MKKTTNNITLEITQGDITQQKDITAIVNAANAELKTGGGVAGAIHKAAGPELEKKAVPLGPIKPGEAVITSAFNLPNQNVIHCLGPVYGKDKPEDKLLANCYTNALHLADSENIDSIAFPAISTGVFGYPLEEAAEVILDAIKTKLNDLQKVKTIRMVLFSEEDTEVFKSKFNKIFNE